jgi:hypothetical protein
MTDGVIISTWQGTSVTSTVEVANKMQQFPFIDLFKSALHVSGDIFFKLLLKMGENIARNM